MKRLNHDNGTWRWQRRQEMAFGQPSSVAARLKLPLHTLAAACTFRGKFRPPARLPRRALGQPGTVTSAMLALHAFAAKGTGARSIAARG